MLLGVSYLDACWGEHVDCARFEQILRVLKRENVYQRVYKWQSAIELYAVTGLYL
jgi:hypothetical protein